MLAGAEEKKRNAAISKWSVVAACADQVRAKPADAQAFWWLNSFQQLAQLWRTLAAQGEDVFFHHVRHRAAEHVRYEKCLELAKRQRGMGGEIRRTEQARLLLIKGDKDHGSLWFLVPQCKAFR